MRQTTTFRRLFNRTKLAGEIFSEDWPDAYLIERSVVVSTQWNYDAPGGSSSAEVYEFRGLYVSEDDSADMCGPYKSLRNAMKAMNIQKEEEPERASAVTLVEAMAVKRKTKSKKTKIDPEVEALVASAVFDRGSAHQWQSMGNAIKKDSIRAYAIKYKKEKGALPTELHTVSYGVNKIIVNLTPVKIFRYKKP